MSGTKEASIDAHNLSRLPRKPLILACLGVACFLGWMTSLLLPGGVVSGQLAEGVFVYDPFFAAASFSGGMTCILFSLVLTRWQGLIATNAALKFFIAMTTICLVCTLVLGLSLVDEIRLYYLLGAAIGVSVSIVLIQWLTLLSNYDPKDVVTIFLVALTIVIVSFIMVHFCKKVLRDPLLTSLCSVGFLLCSAVMFLLTQKYLHPSAQSHPFARSSKQAMALPEPAYKPTNYETGGISGAGGGAGGVGGSSVGDLGNAGVGGVDSSGGGSCHGGTENNRNKALRGALLQEAHEAQDARDANKIPSALLRLVVFSITVSIVIQFLFMFNIEYSKMDLFVRFTGNMDQIGLRATIEIIGCSFCGVVVLMLLYIMRKTSKKPGFIVLILYRAIVLSIIMALGFTLSQETPAIITYTFVLLAHFLAQIGIWALALYVAFLFGTDTASYVVYPLLAQFFGYFLGFTLSGIVLEPILSSPSFAQGILLIFLGAIGIVSLFVFTDQDVSRSSRVTYIEQGGGKDINEKCRLAQELYVLTARETEILTLLAHGRNAVSIQEMLFVSYNTVKAHKHNIYAKLGVHSQQELLTLIERLE